MALHDEAMRAFEPVGGHGMRRTSARDSLLDPAMLLAPSAPGTAFRSGARFAFVIDSVAGQSHFAGRIPAASGALTDRLRDIARHPARGDDPHYVTFDTIAGTLYALALWVMGMPDSPLRRMYGIAADPAALHSLLDSLVSAQNLLPGVASSRRFTGDDIAIRLTRRDGGTIYETRAPIGHTAATDSVGLEGGAVRTTVDLSPAVTNALLVGGTPKSQLPALMVMLVLATALAAVTLVHQRRARDLQAARERFVANVSHELRTPLAQISMFAETLHLGRERSTAERRQFASIILAEARRLTNLVDGVVRLSRASGAPEPLRLTPVDLGPVILSTIETFSPLAQAADAQVATDLSTDAWARIEPDRFRQILLNLLDNAIKHVGRGAHIRVALDESGDTVRILVDDDGPGIPAESRERIFEPFVRLERTKVAGAGIGLSVVRDLVVAHGGTVSVDGSPLGGARFLVTLPRVQPGVAPEPTAETVATLGS
jgi:signal transduction histidine kinase